MFTANLLSYIGVIIMVGVSGLGSIFGATMVANASVGAMKKNPAAFGGYMMLTAIPCSQGLYGFAGFFLILNYVTPGVTMVQAIAILSLGVLVGVLNLLSALRQAQVCINGVIAVGNGQNDLAGKALILAVFAELYAILGVAAVFLALSVMGSPVV